MVNIILSFFHIKMMNLSVLQENDTDEIIKMAKTIDYLG